MKHPFSFDVAAFTRLIETGAESFNVSVTPQQIDQFLTYTELLLTWNRTTNLTRITNVSDIAVKHFLDSMAALPHLPQKGRLLDIGSGAGFPGLVLKIMRPELTVTLIDSVRKKTSFLQHMKRTLSLSEVNIHHVRAEALKNEPSEKHAYQAVVSRALASLKNFTDLAIPFLAMDGFICAYKGKIDEREMSELRESPIFASLVVSQKTLPLPHTDQQRTLVIIQLS